MADDQRTASGSALGHAVGVGGNGLLWAFGTYGWAVAAVLGGVSAVAAGVAWHRRRTETKRAEKKAKRRVGSGRGGGRRGLFGGGRKARAGAGTGGRSRRTGGRSTAARSRRAGTRPTGKAGLLKRAAQRRSTAPKRGGGIPKRGSTPAGRRNPLSKGRPPESRKRTPTGGGGRRNTPPPKGGRRRNPLIPRPSRNQNKNSGRKDPTRKRQPKRNPAQTSGPRTPVKRRPKTTKDKTRWALPNPFKQRPDKPPTKNPTPPEGKKMPTSSTAGSRASTRTRGTAGTRAAKGGGAGAITQAAEVLAGALAKPDRKIETVKGMDGSLHDLSTALEIVTRGIADHGKVLQEAMPDEGAAHEQVGQLAQQAAQLAEAAKMLRADQWRRNAGDHQRIDDGRKNERGYDWTTNQD